MLINSFVVETKLEKHKHFQKILGSSCMHLRCGVPGIRTERLAENERGMARSADMAF